MTTSQFKKIARTLKTVYAQLEKEAIEQGVSLLSTEYEQVLAKARLAVLEQAGFTIEEYRSAKAKVAGFSQADLLDVVEVQDSKIGNIHDRYIPTVEDIERIAEEVAQKYVVPPVVTNQIVKETTIEKPRIIETVREITNREEYDDKHLTGELASLKEKLSNIEKPVSKEEIQTDIKNYFAELFEHNINTLGMPDFRKLAMGLQAQIDAIDNSGGGGTWGSITGTLSDQTDLQTALDAKADESGALTQFVGNNTWKVWYSDGSGDVTELALGADGTFLKSNGAAVAPSFATPAGSGDVSKVGTPVDNQVGVWTGDGTLEGDAALTFDTTDNTLTTGILNSTTLTASEIVGTNADKDLVSLAVATYPSLAELAYVKGVTSAIQTQINTKAPSTSPTFATSITGSYLTASEILITDGSKNIVSAAVATYPSLTELSYVKGVTSAIQTQLGTKAGTALSNLASVAINTTLVSDTDNTDALGTTAIAWSDLFLGSGGTIVFNSAPSTADVTITHSANTLTIAGGTLALGAENLTMTGSLAATGARVTKGWFTDIESTNMPTVGGTAILTSLTAPQFTTIELGHATQNTLSASGGILSIESVAIPTISSTDNLTNKTLTEAIIAGTPNAAGEFGRDTTQSALNYYDNGALGTIPKIVASGVGTQTFTNDVNTDQDFTSVWTIPANSLITNKKYRVTVVLETVTGTSTATITLYCKIGASKVYISGLVSNLPDAQTRTRAFTFLISGRAAAGASANVTTSALTASWTDLANTVDQPVALATNGTLAITPGITYSATGSTDTVELQSWMVEELN